MNQPAVTWIEAEMSSLLYVTSWIALSIASAGATAFVVFVPAALRPSLFDRESRAHGLALILMWGLLIDAFVGLVSGSTTTQNIAAAIFVAVAGGLLIRSPGGVFPAALQSRQDILTLALIAVVIVTLGFAAYVLPLHAWDARSIWFFHAKVIYLDNGLHHGTFWSTPEYAWSHKDYPKLVPMLAARFAATFGFWNEYLPKGALIVLALAGLFGLRALCRRTLTFAFILLFGGALLGSHLWDGYMDAWLAVFGCIAITALSQWAVSGGVSAGVLGVTALGVAMTLKNEGNLLLVSCLPVAFLGLWRYRYRISLRVAPVLLVFLPAFYWTHLVHTLQLKGDLSLVDLLTRAARVVRDRHELAFRTSYLISAANQVSDVLLLWPLSLVIALCSQRSATLILTALGVAVYLAGMCVVYYGTPLDFRWHVATSLDRVLMLPCLTLTCAVVLMIEQIAFAERGGDARTDQRASAGRTA